MTDSDRQSVPSESIDSDTAFSSALTTPLQEETPPDHDVSYYAIWMTLLHISVC